MMRSCDGDDRRRAVAVLGLEQRGGVGGCKVQGEGPYKPPGVHFRVLVRVADKYIRVYMPMYLACVHMA